MDARRQGLEAKRAVLFTEWKSALETAHGNVTAAAVKLFAKDQSAPERKRARSYGDVLTRRFCLLDYATALRVKAGGHPGAGRPKPMVKKTKLRHPVTQFSKPKNGVR